MHKTKSSHVEDALEESTGTQIPMDVFSVEVDGIKTTITTMVKDIRLKNANHVLQEVMLQGNSNIAFSKVCQFNFILHVLKLIILEKLTTVT